MTVNSCVQPRTPHNIKLDMPHMTHKLLLSLAARRPASSLSGAYKIECSNLAPSTPKFRVHRGANTCLMAHAPDHIYGANCVEPNDRLCTDLQWVTLVSSALPCLGLFRRTVYSSVLPIVQVMSVVATNAMIVNCHDMMSKTTYILVFDHKTETDHFKITRRQG